MIDRIGGSPTPFQSVQGSRTYQNATRNTTVFREALMNEMEEAPKSESQGWSSEFQPQQIDTAPRFDERPSASVSSPVSRPRMQSAPSSYLAQLQPMIQEVQQLAEASGYIGVTSQDVLRAYQSGRSLLADYRV